MITRCCVRSFKWSEFLWAKQFHIISIKSKKEIKKCRQKKSTNNHALSDTRFFFCSVSSYHISLLHYDYLICLNSTLNFSRSFLAIKNTSLTLVKSRSVHTLDEFTVIFLGDFFSQKCKKAAKNSELVNKWEREKKSWGSG